MSRACCVLLWLMLALAAGTSQGQDVPKLTEERKQAVDELIQSGVKAGAIEIPDKGPVRIDQEKLRAVVADRRDKINAELVDALVAFWFDVEERREPIAVALLRVCGQEKKDDRALGVAAFLSGKMAERQPAHWREAEVSYANAVKHCAVAKELPLEAASSNNLAVLHQAQGEYVKAEQLFRRALATREDLYPKARFPHGHPDLALSINNLAVLHMVQGEYAKAEPLYRRALEMYEGLYPKARFPHGHPDLAGSINNLALLHHDQGEYIKAEPLFRRALDIYEGLYPKARFPKGHPRLAGSINNLALLYKAQAEYAKAEQLYRRALDLNEGLYPKARFPHGHPDLALSINNLAGLHQAQGEYAKGL